MTTHAEKLAARHVARIGSTYSDPTVIPMKIDPRSERMSGVARHGYTPFDVPFISQIEGNLWQGGCRNGLVLPSEIEHVISLYPWEQYTVAHELKSMTSIVMYDAEDQGFGQIVGIASWVNACVEDGPTLVHCQAGLNRSSLVAATSLVIRLGMSGPEAIKMIREARSPACLCNPAFEAWIAAL